jgi:hypothetical protein
MNHTKAKVIPAKITIFKAHILHCNDKSVNYSVAFYGLQ